MAEEAVDLKRHSVGFELEVFLINEKGEVVDGAQELLKSFGPRKPFIQEAIDSVLEFTTNPDTRVLGSVNSFFSRVARVNAVLEQKGLALMPLGTYPGKNATKPVKKPWYDVQAKVLGREKDYQATKVCGFHLHFGLPKGGLLPGKRRMRVYADKSLRRKVTSLYNFFIAADPALSCFLQSSPFYEGHYHGKDSRILVSRDLRFSGGEGTYSEFREFGALPRYAETITDLNDLAVNRKRRFLALSRQKLRRIPLVVRRANPFRFFWGPVRINDIGTIEQRGMDCNHPRLILAVGSSLNSVLKRIFSGQLGVRISDEGIDKPFSIDGKQILIPPHSHLRKVLSTPSATKGLEDANVKNYCAAFYKLVSGLQKEEGTLTVSSPLAEMLSSRKTVSDEILAFAKSRGWKEGQTLDAALVREIAIDHSLRFRKEVEELIELMNYLL